YMPLQDKISGAQVEINKKNSMLTDVKEQVSKLEKLEKDIVRMEVDLEQSLEQLPAGDEIADLLKQISDNGRSSGLEIRRFERGTENINSSYDLVAEVPIALAIQGGFHRVAMFFDQISQMDRIVHVKNIDIEIEEESIDSVSLLVEGSIIAFRQLTPEEVKKKEEKKKKNKKRRGKRK
ncbi:MAG: type 4a pilus biogenesis protein PilO, partial [Myxococcota bacterium]|nr:type 4a pilus biogenesis protein PilO [Myxococcota bacterium]